MLLLHGTIRLVGRLSHPRKVRDSRAGGNPTRLACLRCLVISILPVVFITTASTLASTAGAAERRPNIVFAFADDWGRCASAYARLTPGGINDLVSTPNFDRVARQGVLFRNAYVNAPSCTPCRSSLLSGQYFFRTGRGAILQGAVWDSAIPSYPLILAEAGYHIGHTSKVWSPGRPVNAPYGASKYAYNKRGGRFNRFSQAVEHSTNRKAARQALFNEVRGNFNDFLAKRGKDQPFCYWFGPTNCHRTWVRGSGKSHWGINPDDLKGKVPPFLPDNGVIREDIADYLGEVQAFDAGLGVLLDELQRTGELDNTIVVVSGDHGAAGFSRGKCNLVDFGVAVPLAICWGHKIASPGRVVDDFVNLPDLAPTFLEAGGAQIPKVMTGCSLWPILNSNKSGTVDPSRDYVVVGRERHVARARTDAMPYPQRAIRTKEFLYIRNFKPQRWPMGTAPGYGLPPGPMPEFAELERNTFAAFADMDASPTKAWIATHREGQDNQRYFDFAFGRRPAEELYDISNDPHQIHNVAEDAKYAQAKKELTQRLMTILKDNGDPRVQGDGSTYDRPPFARGHRPKKQGSSGKRVPERLKRALRI